MVLDPAVLLLDEPLGALDLKLREHMKIELKQLQHEFGTTFVYITHDQSEALVMSDRVAVMNAGRFEQVGTPEALYYSPASAFVAGFVGNNNRLSGRVAAADGAGRRIETASGLSLVAAAAPAAVGQGVEIFLRPEAIAVDGAASVNRMDGTIEDVLFNGAQSGLLVRLKGGETIEAVLPQTGQRGAMRRGQAVALSVVPDSVLVFPARS
jgi:spermidine/putrescine transport system ATP-binding protein